MMVKSRPITRKVMMSQPDQSELNSLDSKGKEPKPFTRCEIPLTECESGSGYWAPVST